MMYGDDFISRRLIELHQQQLRQQAEHHRQAKQFTVNKQPIYGLVLASVGNWLTSTGDALQQRYNQPLELVSEPSAECAKPC